MRNLNHLFSGQSHSAGPGELSIRFFFDENSSDARPNVGGVAVGTRAKDSLWRASSNSEPTRAVGPRWRAVFGSSDPRARCALDLPSRHLQAFVSSLHCFVYKTVVEGLPHVELLGFRMVDKFQRVRHCSLDHLERARESTSVVFKATLQIGVIVDSGKAPQRAFGGRGIFSG